MRPLRIAFGDDCVHARPDIPYMVDRFYDRCKEPAHVWVAHWPFLRKSTWAEYSAEAGLSRPAFAPSMPINARLPTGGRNGATQPLLTAPRLRRFDDRLAV